MSIRWFENPAFDTPELNSPQPCIHGAGCVYTVKNADVISPGCCRYVHPGEEGTGRRLFPATNGKPACVRLIAAGFYERRRLRLPWSEWCALNGIPYVRNEPGVKHAPVKRVPFGKNAIGHQIAEVAEAKKKIMATVAKHVAENPGWARTIATLANEQELEWGGEDPDRICTFCHEKADYCGEDHGDEMRDIVRERSERD